jgi:hypothetical protein
MLAGLLAMLPIEAATRATGDRYGYLSDAKLDVLGALPR